MALSPQQRKFYDDNGYVVVENIIPLNMLAEMKRRISEIVEAASQERGARVPGTVFVEPGAPTAATPSGTSAGPSTAPSAVAKETRAKPALRKLTALASEDEFFLSVAKLPEIISIAQELTQSTGPLKLYDDQAFLKPAFEGSEKPLHQDNSYFRIVPHSAGVTCWIAVDASTVENGCMRYIPGTHKMGLMKHKSLGGPHLTPDVDFKLNEEIPVPIPAGAAIFHHLLSCHSSRANTSPNSRRAWALHLANPNGESPVKPWEKMLDLV